MDREPEPKRLVIRATTDPPAADPVASRPKNREPKAPLQPKALGKDVDVGLGVAILGSILAAFGPLLPWWKITTLQMGIQLSTVTGTGAWVGIFAFAGGITALRASTYLYVKPERRGTLGLVILAAGAVTFTCSAFAAFSGENILDTIFKVSNQIGIFISLTGGLIAAIGGYLQSREGSRK